MDMNDKGFTIVELMVAVVVAMIAMGAIAVVFQMQFKTLNREEQASEMRNNLKTAVELISRELLMAGYDPSRSSNAGIVSPLSENSINFTIDRNGDGEINGNREDVTYTYDETDLAVVRNSRIIARNITGLSFTYHNADDETTGDAAEVRRIKFQVSGRSGVRLPDAGYLTLTLSSDITPRNLAF